MAAFLLEQLIERVKLGLRRDDYGMYACFFRVERGVGQTKLLWGKTRRAMRTAGFRSPHMPKLMRSRRYVPSTVATGEF